MSFPKNIVLTHFHPCVKSCAVSDDYLYRLYVNEEPWPSRTHVRRLRTCPVYQLLEPRLQLAVDASCG